MRSQRNKTIDISLDEGSAYLSRCLSPSAPMHESDILDRTLLGSCFDIMPLLPRAFAGLVIADPPYNLSKDFDGESFKRMSEAEYEAYTDSWLRLVKPLMKPDASIYVCCDWRSSAAVSRALEHHFIIRNRISWQREKGRGAAANWKNAVEDIWFATVSDDYVFNLNAVKQRRRVIAPYRRDGQPKDWEETSDGKYRDTCPSNFWDDITVPYWSMAENTAHPTQKPEKLLAKLILASSRQNDLVFDPFLGSGSSAVTAKKLGRHFCGIERSRQYCIFCEKRLEMAEEDKTIQGFHDGVFWERNSGRKNDCEKNKKST